MWKWPVSLNIFEVTNLMGNVEVDVIMAVVMGWEVMVENEFMFVASDDM